MRDVEPETPDYYDILRQVHHSMLFRCLGWRKRKHDDHTLSYVDAFAKTASESIETTVRQRRILFAGFVARMGGERMPRRVMFEGLVGGKGYSGGQEKDWMVRSKEDMTEFGIMFEGWRKAAHRAADGFDGSRKGQSFMWKWHNADNGKA